MLAEISAGLGWKNLNFHLVCAENLPISTWQMPDFSPGYIIYPELLFNLTTQGNFDKCKLHINGPDLTPGDYSPDILHWMHC